MATPNKQDSLPGAETRQETEKVDYAHDEKLKDDGMLEEGEEGITTGRRKKTNPVEISLVRKLDWIMMPCLWIMYDLRNSDGGGEQT